jgi:iron(III) transport system permease protein
VALALISEKNSRGKRAYTQAALKQHHNRQQLGAVAAWLAFSFCALVLLIAFVLPLLQLLLWVVKQGLGSIDARYLGLLSRTLLLGVTAAVLTVGLAVLLAFSRRNARGRLCSFYDLGALGYALPGSVLAVGVMLSFAFIDNQLIVPVLQWLGLPAKPWLLGSVLALLAAYWVRFLAVASGPVDAGLQRIRPSIPEAAQSLGVSGWSLLWQIYLPMLRPGLLTAAVLVFVDVMKEMPATLLLRPFGWDTLAVRIFEMTSEGEWQRAALPALTLILVGLLPVVLAVRQTASK